ncbi:hypothetical protein, partial [Staphylococcus aureus]
MWIINSIKDEIQQIINMSSSLLIISISLERMGKNALLSLVRLVLILNILVYMMVNLVSEVLYRISITQTGIPL